MKSISKWIGVFVVGIFIVSGCGKYESEEHKMQVYKEAESIPVTQADEIGGPEEGGVSQRDVVNIQQRRIIYTCYLDLQVENVDSTFRRVQDLIRQYNGYLAEVQRNQYYGKKTISLRAKIRVPVSNFEKMVSELRALARYELNYELKTTDVTEEYIDVQTRLKVKRELEAQYLDLLKQARSVKEVLEVQEALAQVRSEIESIEGRLKFLENQTDYATIHLTLDEYIGSGLPVQVGFWSRLGKGIEEGWEMFLTFLIILVSLWPFWVFLGAGIVVWRYYRSRRRSLKGQTPAGKETKGENES